MATLSCNCRKIEVQLGESTPRLTAECLCCDCVQKLVHAASLGCGGRPFYDILSHKTPARLDYFTNKFTLAKGGEDDVYFWKLRESAASEVMSCATCHSILMITHPLYNGNCVAVLPDQVKYTNYTPSEPEIRWNVMDWTLEEQKNLSKLPVFYAENGEFKGDLPEIFGLMGGKMTVEIPANFPGDTSYQTLQGKKETKIIGLAESPTSYSLVCAAKKAAAGYAPTSVQQAWDNHFSAFGAQDVDKILLDYDEKSVLKAFNHKEGALTTATGVAEIRDFFVGLFKTLSDLSALAAPVVEVTEAPAKQVYLIWSCPSSGIASAQDTFIFDDNFKIRRQNIAFTA